MERWSDRSPASSLGKPVRIMSSTPIMEIKAPRGIMRIFENPHQYFDSQCEAIKAFMEEHRHD